MVNKLIYSLLFLILLIPAELFAQYDSGLDYRKIRITLVPGLSTNGVDAPNYTARYSLNILAGYHGGLDGVEIGPLNITKKYTRGVQLGSLNVTGGYMEGLQIGGLGNISRGDASGIQFAGLGNLAGGSIQGIQFSGLANVSGGDLQGIQIAGITNVSGGSIQGIQISGIGNVARHEIQGLQFSGIFNANSGDGQGILVSGITNISGGSTQGILISGIANVAEDQQGIFIGGIVNVGRTIQGIQIAGVTNIADRAQGVQIGLFNFARDFEGVPVGLISLYGNGRKNVEVWTNENGFSHLGLKLGTRYIYNMISVGYNPFITGRDVWSLGWSIGSYRTLDEKWERPELRNYYSTHDFSFHYIQEGSWSRTLNNLFSYRYLLGREFSSGISLFAGPTFNLLVSEEDGNEDYTHYSIFKKTGDNRDTRFWIGFTAGIQFFGH